MKEIWLLQFTNKYGILKGTILYYLCSIGLTLLGISLFILFTLLLVPYM